MSGRGEGNGDNARMWLRGALVVVIIAAALGIFGSQSSMEKPKLSALNIAGIVVMLLGLLLTIMSRTLADRVPENRRDLAATAFKLGGMLVCILGAIVVFL